VTPYIPGEARVAAELDPSNGGELNYKFATVIDDYVRRQGLSYATINDIVGALEGVKQEFYARFARPYEHVKLTQNGEAFPQTAAALEAAFTGKGGEEIVGTKCDTGGGPGQGCR
jgi:hypothetical protein